MKNEHWLESHMSFRRTFENAANDNIDEDPLSSMPFLSLMIVFGIAAFLLVETAFRMTGAMNNFMGFDSIVASPIFSQGE